MEESRLLGHMKVHLAEKFGIQRLAATASEKFDTILERLRTPWPVVSSLEQLCKIGEQSTQIYRRAIAFAGHHAYSLILEDRFDRLVRDNGELAIHVLTSCSYSEKFFGTCMKGECESCNRRGYQHAG